MSTAVPAFPARPPRLPVQRVFTNAVGVGPIIKRVPNVLGYVVGFWLSTHCHLLRWSKWYAIVKAIICKGINYSLGQCGLPAGPRAQMTGAGIFLGALIRKRKKRNPFHNGCIIGAKGVSQLPPAPRCRSRFFSAGRCWWRWRRKYRTRVHRLNVPVDTPAAGCHADGLFTSVIPAKVLRFAVFLRNPPQWLVAVGAQDRVQSQVGFVFAYAAFVFQCGARPAIGIQDAWVIDGHVCHSQRPAVSAMRLFGRHFHGLNVVHVLGRPTINQAASCAGIFSQLFQQFRVKRHQVMASAFRAIELAAVVTIRACARFFRARAAAKMLYGHKYTPLLNCGA
jgi:hypothetical protein